MSEEKSLRALVMTSNQEEKIKFGFFQTDYLRDEKVKVNETFYDEFQEGSKQNRFDFVVALLHFNEDTSADDVEMMEEFYQHYCKAPVFTWVIKSSTGEEAGLKKFLSNMVPHSQVILCGGVADTNKADSIKEAYKVSKDKYNELKASKVEPLFKKYDKDGSGAIDKDELDGLCKDLGVPLDEEQLKTALEDLDINKDGVIDLNEFCNWWFSGFQTYDTYRRGMLKTKYKCKNALVALKNGEVGNLLEGQLTTKKHQLKVGFNTPENVGLAVEAGVYYGQGKTTNAMASDLEAKFSDACILDKAALVASDPDIKSVNDFLSYYFEVKIKMNGDQSALGEKLSAAFDAFDIKVPGEGIQWFKLKCVQEGEYMCIGTNVSVPNSVIDKNFQNDASMKDMQWYHRTIAANEKMSALDQDYTVKANFGTSVKDILASETPLINELCKGFSVEVQIEFVAQLKKIIFDLLKDSETLESPLAPFLMFASPFILLTLNGNIDLSFEDYEEVKDLPMMEPFLANFNQLFEGALGQDIETLLKGDERINLEEMGEESKTQESGKQFKKSVDMVHAVLDLLEAASEDGDIQVSAVFPKMIAAKASLKSAEIAKLIRIVILSTYYEKALKPQFEYLKE